MTMENQGTVDIKYVLVIDGKISGVFSTINRAIASLSKCNEDPEHVYIYNAVVDKGEPIRLQYM